jgi:hypothetical protein
MYDKDEFPDISLDECNESRDDEKSIISLTKASIIIIVILVVRKAFCLHFIFLFFFVFFFSRSLSIKEIRIWKKLKIVQKN